MKNTINYLSYKIMFFLVVDWLNINIITWIRY